MQSASCDSESPVLETDTLETLSFRFDADTDKSFICLQGGKLNCPFLPQPIPPGSGTVTHFPQTSTTFVSGLGSVQEWDIQTLRRYETQIILLRNANLQNANHFNATANYQERNIKYLRAEHIIPLRNTKYQCDTRTCLTAEHTFPHCKTQIPTGRH